MKLFSPILFLIFSLLTGLDSKSSTSASLASPPVDSSLQGPGQPSGSSPNASQNSTRDRSTPQSPVTVGPEPSEMPFPVSPDISPGDFTEIPISDLPETPPPNSPENSMPDLPRTPDTLQIRASKTTFLKPSEISNHDLTGTPQSEPSETSKLNSSKASLTGSETPHTDPSPITHNHQEYPETPKQDVPEMSPGKTPGSPSADPTKTLDLQSPETSDPGTTDTSDSESLLTTIPDQTETLQPTFPVTHNFSLMDVIPPQFPTTHYQNTTENATTSHLEVTTSLHMETPASFRVEPTTPHEPHLNPKPEALGAIQVTTPEPPASGSGELKVPQNSNPKGQDTPSPSARIVGPPAASELTNQVVPATPRTPQRHNRGETVNTIIVVERVKETGVTLVGRPRGSTGGALCLFFAGTGLLIGIFLLLWCLYRRASRHRPFAHHRLPDSGDEPVLHLDTPKDPFDLYFYAPDAWIPSHIATKQPPSTPPLPPKLPPPPRGGRPQRLEALSPAALPNSFV